MTRIVCEVGSNFRNLADCIYSIGQARAYGADAVKFQLFSDFELYGYGAQEDRGVRAEWLPKLKEKADACGIDLMVTAFSPEGVLVVDPYVTVHKVASAECCHLGILKAVAATGKPVYISTGGHGADELKMAIKCLKDHGAGQVTALYCVSEYPTRRVDVRAFADSVEWGDIIGADQCGFSDHTRDVLGMPQLAALHCASVIEKHVSFIDDPETADAPHSLNAAEFDEMVRGVRSVREIFALDPAPCERDMLERHNRRLMVTVPIAAGEALAYGVNFGVFRSRTKALGALAPWQYPRVDGRPAKCDLVPGDEVSPDTVG